MKIFYDGWESANNKDHVKRLNSKLGPHLIPKKWSDQSNGINNIFFSKIAPHNLLIASKFVYFSALSNWIDCILKTYKYHLRYLITKKKYLPA